MRCSTPLRIKFVKDTPGISIGFWKDKNIPSFAILDETDSGLDVDAVRTVSSGVEEYQKSIHGGLLIITHSTRILESLHVDATHVLVDGRIVASGDGSLVDEINENGFERFL